MFIVFQLVTFMKYGQIKYFKIEKLPLKMRQICVDFLMRYL